jgi:N-acetylglucosaminyldiphosphoundecaprenol N-acetyl-beta-D-mannosaminyltransferase
VNTIQSPIPRDVSSITPADVRIDARSFRAVIDAIIAKALQGGAPEYVVTPNAHHVVLYQHDEHFRQIYRPAFLSVPGGVPLLWQRAFLASDLVAASTERTC